MSKAQATHLRKSVDARINRALDLALKCESRMGEEENSGNFAKLVSEAIKAYRFAHEMAMQADDAKQVADLEARLAQLEGQLNERKGHAGRADVAEAPPFVPGTEPH